MKHKITRKELRERFSTIVCVGYCNLQTLLVDIDPACKRAGNQYNLTLTATAEEAIVNRFTKF